MSNFTSHYGQFIPIGRIDGNRFDPPGGANPRWHETGFGRMGSPLWADPERYVRNSPVFHADEVTTPVMLIHGDLDTATLLTQAEEMFTALHRQDKDALFVKYVGEHHLVAQPQNQRDMWQRVFTFLEDNGVTPGAAGGK